MNLIEKEWARYTHFILGVPIFPPTDPRAQTRVVYPKSSVRFGLGKALGEGG